MKALKLSTICAFLLILSACTKDVDTLSSSSSSLSETSEAQLSNNRPATAGGGQDGTVGVTNDNKPKDLTSIDITVSPNPVNQGSNYTVTGVVVFPVEVNTGKVVIERAIKLDGTGQQVYTSKEEATDWVNFAEEEITVAEMSHTIIKTALASENPGFYGFRLHYIPSGNGDKVKGGQSTEMNLEVKKACQFDAFNVRGEATAEPLADGEYEFTIKFHLTNPEAITGIKFQGGATAGGQQKHKLTDIGDMTLVHDNNQNTVLKWEGSLEKCTTKTLTFKYKRKFSCPATEAVVTGEWTAKQGETELHIPVHVTFTCPQ